MAKTSHPGKLLRTEEAQRLATMVGVHLNRTYVTTEGTVKLFPCGSERKQQHSTNNRISTLVY